MPDIQPKKLRFTLICRGLESETYVLNNAPVEWQNTGFENERDNDTQGIVRKLTSPTTWVTDAAYLLRREYYNHGQLLADVKLVVDKFNTASNIWKYQTIFTGKFDFSAGSFTDNENNVTASIINDDLSVYIDANKDTDYSIPVDVPEAVTVNLTPIKLVEQPSLILVNENNPQANVFPAWAIAAYTQNAVNASVFNVTRNKEDDPDFTTAGSVYFIAQTDTTVQHRVVFNCFLDYSSNAVYAIQIWSSKGYMVKQLYVYANGTNVGNTVVSFDISFAVAVAKGENLKLYFDSSKKDDDRGFRIDGTTSASIELSYQTISDATQCKALPIAYLFKELIKRMNRDTAYPIQSVLLQSSLSNIYITCSDAIRKIEAGQVFQAGETLQIGGRYLVLGDTIRYNNILYPVNTYFTYKVGVDTFSSDSSDGFVRQVASSPAIITNWSDFLKSVRGWQGGQAGFGINNALAVLEDLGYFFSPTLIADLGSNPKWGGLSAAEEYGYNSIKVGYNDQQYTSTNGSQEVNSTQNYSTYALKPVKELDLTIPYRADPHGIEEIRVRPPDSASSKSDNDTIALWLVKGNGGIYQPDTVDSYNYSGVDAGYYNWQLTPKHNLLRGGAFLHAVFTSLEGYMLNFESGLKNTNFQINGVKESDSVLVSSLPKALFLPQTVTITVPGSDDRQRAIDAMPYGYLQFMFKGNVYKGHILSANTNEYNNAQMDYKLLLTNDVNLSTLIR